VTPEQFFKERVQSADAIAGCSCRDGGTG